MSKSPTAKFWRDSSPSQNEPNIDFSGLKSSTKKLVESASAFPSPPPISSEEWTEARTGPRPVVDGWIYEDVGVLIAPGGTGKTTLVLFEAIHIVLGWRLFGAEIINAGPVMILTAEDDRNSLIGRLRLIADELGLSDDEIRRIKMNILISDVSGNPFKLSEIRGQAVVPSTRLDSLVRTVVKIQPAVVFIDPAISFGVGESRINDAEQGLIEAARRIRNEACCAVMFIHHTGKQNARLQLADQYAGRGGSAFADGSRMVHVLQPVDRAEWLKATGETLLDGEIGLLLSRPKISHAPPQPPIYLKRSGHIFLHYDRRKNDSESELAENSDRVLSAIRGEISNGRLPTGRSLEALLRGELKQRAVRDAIHWLQSEGRITSEPNKVGRGGTRSYLRPLERDAVDGA